MLDWVDATQGEASQLLWLHRDRALVLLMLHTGVTIDELCALNTSDVVEDGQNQRYLRVGSMQRLIPLSLEVRQGLSRWLVMRGLVFGSRPFPELFVTDSRKRLNHTMVRGLLARLQRDSGVMFDTFALRHTFVRDLVWQGLSPTLISGLLGRPSNDVIALYVQS